LTCDTLRATGTRDVVATACERVLAGSMRPCERVLSIVLDRLAFDVGRLQSFFAGGTDQGIIEVIDPVRGSTGFHEGEVDLFALEDGGEASRIGSGDEESRFVCGGIEEVVKGVELAKVKSENAQSRFVREPPGWNECD
jgi:hypothetical protein